MRNLNVPFCVDSDGDGDLDLVASVGYASKHPATGYPHMPAHRNDVGQAQNLIRIHLDGGAGTGVNRSAIGAVVRVTAGGRTQTQYVSGGYGHGNVQNDFVLTFGLGAACDIDAIDVRWPDPGATVSHFSGVPSNTDVTLTYRSAVVKYGAKRY